MTPDAARARVVEVLAGCVAFRLKGAPGDPWKYDGIYVCSCGAEFQSERRVGGTQIAHRAHLADALMPVLAEMWDDGMRAGQGDLLGFDPGPNPLRGAAST